VKLDAQPAARHVVGPDYICMWLGEALLAPLRPEKLANLGTLDPATLDAATLDASAGAERFWLEMRVLDSWRAVGPWRKQDKAYRPASLADQIDNFVALGNWRVETHLLGPDAAASALPPAASPRLKTKPAAHSPSFESEAAPCTLHVALAGKLPVADADWRQRAAQEIAAAGIGGRALVCVAPVAGPLRVLRARNSWLVLWPSIVPTCRPHRSKRRRQRPRSACPSPGSLRSSRVNTVRWASLLTTSCRSAIEFHAETRKLVRTQYVIPNSVRTEFSAAAVSIESHAENPKTGSGPST
jgi:hypothetical protein